jgi:Rhs element Vgr protein
MKAPSPLTAVGAKVAFAVSVKGKAIDSSYQVISIDTWVSVNKVPRAQLVLFDGSAPERDFPISNEATFVPGAKLEIKAGYDDAKATIFEGVIVKMGIEISESAGSKLVLDLADEAIKMTLGRKNAAFEKTTDSDLIGKLIAASGLEKDVDATSTTHERIVQLYATDWDLMLTRAEANGLVVTAAAGKVTVKKPDASQQAVLRIEYGESILDFQAEIDAVTQYTSAAIKSHAWDHGTQALLTGEAGSASPDKAGNVSGDDLAGVFKVASSPSQSGAPLAQEALTAWAKAELARSRLAKLRGHVRFAGSDLAVAGKTIELAGVGERFNGTVLIGGVHHGIRDGSWLTTVTFGLSPRPFAAEAPRIAAPCAAGQLPPVRGLQTGIVKQVSKDEAGEFRVLVTLPLLQETEKGVWARLGTFYASNSFGAVFYPEVGDEVILGFMNEDPRYPIILGSVYGKAHPPPVEPDEKNSKKAIVTRSKVKITIEDDDQEKPVIEIVTPGERKLRMDDKEGSITISDKDDNKVIISKDGITMESAKDITLTAKGNITLTAKADMTLDATGKLALSAKGDASMEGMNVAVKGTTALKAEGGMTGELKAGATLTIQGALVKIN